MAKKELLELQMDELQAKYQLLRLEFSQADNPVVQGTLRFDADYQGKEARGEYDIEIRIPDDYPRCVPSVRETGGRVPKDFHRYTNSDLCLGAPVAVRKTFLESPTLLAFVENLVIPHLFSHAYFAEHGEMPFGDLEHGSLGILDFYKDLFGTDIPSTLLILKTLADGAQRYKSYLSCPCRSTKSLGECHGPQLEGLWDVMPSQNYAEEHKQIIAGCKRIRPDIDYNKYLPHKALRNKNARLRRHKPEVGTRVGAEGGHVSPKEPSASPNREKGVELRDAIRQQFSPLQNSAKKALHVLALQAGRADGVIGRGAALVEDLGLAVSLLGAAPPLNGR
jgi:hypothetical protein